MTRLEHTAVAAARELLEHLDSRYPIDPAAVCAHLGIEYWRRVLPLSVDGMYWRASTGTPYICVNVHERKHPGRVLFTVGHECGHHMLASRMRITRTHFLDSPKMHRTPLESACNLFAAELLMPETVIRTWWEELQGNRRYRQEIIANRCGVSNLALSVRLDKLGLIVCSRVGDFYR